MADTHAHTEQPASGKKPLPQLNPDSFASQLFWLAVVFAALYVLMARSAIPRIREVLTKRDAQIQHDLDAAEKAKSEAEKAKADYEQALVGAKTKAADVLVSTQREIDDFIAAEQAKLSETLDGIISEADTRIAKQQADAAEEIKPIVQELTADICKRFLPKAPTKAAISKALKPLEGA